MTPEEIVTEMRLLSVEAIAFIQGAAFQLLTMHVGCTEAELYATFAAKAAVDPDCQRLRIFAADGHVEVPS